MFKRLCSYFACRGRRPLPTSTPKTLAGLKDSSQRPKLWAGEPLSCCKDELRLKLPIQTQALQITETWEEFSGDSVFRCRLFASRDSADRVVGEKGSYEELIASSHEIAASTAQLVAASKVRTPDQVLTFYKRTPISERYTFTFK